MQIWCGLVFRTKPSSPLSGVWCVVSSFWLITAEYESNWREFNMDESSCVELALWKRLKWYCPYIVCLSFIISYQPQLSVWIAAETLTSFEIEKEKLILCLLSFSVETDEQEGFCVAMLISVCGFCVKCGFSTRQKERFNDLILM